MFADDMTQETGDGNSPRHPQRDDVVTLKVRIDLEGSKPPIWRRLELASDLYLDTLHLITQVAFGWTNSHLHDFASGNRSGDVFAERYLNEFIIEAGEDGILESDVRLDEVLAKPGDSLVYTYDFGDNWEHTIRLEAVEPRVADVSIVRCVGGRRAGPPDDCGGIWEYEWMIHAARDNKHPEHAEALEQFEFFFPDGAFNPDAFDQAQLNWDLEQATKSGFSFGGFDASR